MRPLVCRELNDGCRVGLREVFVYVTTRQHTHELNDNLVVHGILVFRGMQVVGEVATQGYTEQSVGAHRMVCVDVFLVNEVVGFQYGLLSKWGRKVSSVLRFSWFFLFLLHW